MNSDLRAKFLLSLVLALLVYIALVLYSDWRQLANALKAFPWQWLPIVVSLTLVNYVGRALRWYWYLRLLQVPISLRDSSRIFGVGMLMVMTPGKAGEFLKSYMIKQVTGTAMSVTAPAILAERITDGMAMLLLASAGLFAFSDPAVRWVAAVLTVGFGAIVVLSQVRPLASWLLRLGGKMPMVGRFAHHLSHFYESSYRIFRPANFLFALGTGALFWAAEGVAYYIVLVGLDVQPSLSGLFVAVFVFCISTVIGAVVALPGGLGGVEGSLVALSVQLYGLVPATATAAALLIRLSTLWIGVLVGVVSFLLWPQLLAGSPNARHKSLSQQAESNI